jgi:predicted dehydrogenase
VWLGEVAAVSAAMGMTSDRDERGDRDGSDVHAEDTFTARLTTADGCAVAFQQTAGAWGPMVQVTRVAGTRGTLWLDGSDVWLADATGTRQLAVPGDLRLPDAPAPSDDPRHRFTHLELGPYTRLAEAFRERILGQPSSSAISPATFDDGVACMEVLDAMRRSTAAGGDVVHLRESGAVRTRG